MEASSSPPRPQRVRRRTYAVQASQQMNGYPHPAQPNLSDHANPSRPPPTPRAHPNAQLPSITFGSQDIPQPPEQPLIMQPHAAFPDALYAQYFNFGLHPDDAPAQTNSQDMAYRGEKEEEGIPGEEGGTGGGSQERHVRPGKKRRRPSSEPQPDLLPAAIKRFSEVAPSVGLDMAQEALQEALERNQDLKKLINTYKDAHQQQRPQPAAFRDDLNWWIDEAQTFLACQNEFDAEKDELEKAMAASLREAEAERQRAEAEEQQLGQAAALERKYGESPLLKELQDVCQVGALVSSQAMKPLQMLLALEKKCKHWYTGRGTFVYFESLGHELSEHLKQEAGRQGVTQLPMQCLSTQPNAPPGFQGASTSSAAPELLSPDGLDSKVASCLDKLATKLEEKESFLQTELARMPSDSNAAIYVPEVFKLPPGMAECEVLNVYSDSD